MPIISMFYGVVVMMYFGDDRRHKKPHIHVEYQEHEAVISIPDGKLLRGSLPPAKLKLVSAWMEIHKDELMASEFNGKGKVEISRFKGLGEMMPRQLKETTMDPRVRTLLRVEIADDDKNTGKLVDQLMGNKPEARFQFIQERAEFAKPDELDI